MSWRCVLRRGWWKEPERRLLSDAGGDKRREVHMVLHGVVTASHLCLRPRLVWWCQVFWAMPGPHVGGHLMRSSPMSGSPGPHLSQWLTRRRRERRMDAGWHLPLTPPPPYSPSLLSASPLSSPGGKRNHFCLWSLYCKANGDPSTCMAVHVEGWRSLFLVNPSFCVFLI